MLNGLSFGREGLLAWWMHRRQKPRAHADPHADAAGKGPAQVETSGLQPSEPIYCPLLKKPTPLRSHPEEPNRSAHGLLNAYRNEAQLSLWIKAHHCNPVNRVKSKDTYHGPAGTAVPFRIGAEIGGRYAIAPLDHPLATKSLVQCVALVIKTPHWHYLGHVDPRTQPEQIMASLQGLDLSEAKVYIREGTQRQLPLLRTFKALQALGLADRVQFIEGADEADTSNHVVSWGEDLYSGRVEWNRFTVNRPSNVPVQIYLN